MRTIGIQLTIYGAVQKCASCVHLPSAIETKEWLEAALNRKFPNADLDVHYVDIEQPTDNEEHQSFSEAILNDEYFYPLLVLNGEVIAEGNPNLKSVSAKVEAAM
ncbi:YuzD family protein [Alkalihalobacillus sp. FSL W8-0930]